VKPLLLFSSPIAGILLLLVGIVVIIEPGHATPALAATPDRCLPTPTQSRTDLRLDRAQWSVARSIISVGKSLDVPPRGWVVAIAAGFQESGLRPIRYGDRDSLGVFQQRTAWGPAAERINPVTATHMFFTGGHGGQRGLLDIPAWQDLSVTQAAQAVEVSAYPNAYSAWETLAVQVVRRLAGTDTSCDPGTWTSPVGGAHFVLTAGFGDCGVHWAACHTGQDFAVPTGTPVLSAGAGVVTFAGWDGPYGNVVHVLHAGGIATWYAHLSQIRTRPGAQIDTGALLGLSGATGNTTGPHLHFEVRTGASTSSNGTPIDPLPWLRQHDAL
jgi:murein DD-endopeptidase MepM/ murein hydrolase activator NlpD